MRMSLEAYPWSALRNQNSPICDLAGIFDLTTKIKHGSNDLRSERATPARCSRRNVIAPKRPCAPSSAVSLACWPQLPPLRTKTKAAPWDSLAPTLLCHAPTTTVSPLMATVPKKSSTAPSDAVSFASSVPGEAWAEAGSVHVPFKYSNDGGEDQDFEEVSATWQRAGADLLRVNSSGGYRCHTGLSTPSQLWASRLDCLG